MVVSDVFLASPQLVAFLRFVVEATLHGKQVRIKAYTIGVEVLRRDVKFDPQIDPIVRVEATRLRRTIERYYSGPGAYDPIIIDLPRGSYVPTFQFREIDARRPAHLPSSAKRIIGLVRIRPLLAAVTAVAFGLIVVAAAAMLRIDTGPRAPADGLAAGNGMPTIYIEPLEITGTPVPRRVSATLLYKKITDAFTRFDTVNVAIAQPQQSDTSARARNTASQSEQRADYRLSGAIEYRDSETSVLFKIVDVGEGKVVWSRTFEQAPATDDQGVTEDAIVVALANALLQSYGAIRARDRAKHIATNVGDPRYRCILEAADAIRSAGSAERDRARNCLERLTAIDPSFAVGFAFLAIIYNREFQQDVGGRARDPLALDKALKAARRAIELQPEDSRAYLALFVVLFNRGDIASAFAAAEKSLQLNKYDTLALGEYGGRLIMAGQVEKGMTLMQQAGEYGAIRPSWHYFYLFLGSYLNGNIKDAAQYASHITTENYALGQVAKAISASAVGDKDQARQAIDKLIALQPSWRSDPRSELARAIPNPDTLDRLARDLAAAGLAIQP